ncbi:phage portal protein [Actinobaculum sp. 352]|nr:phage portal protein [Actinobaculum sp. 352]
MGPNLRRSWEAFQRKALANAGKLIVDTLAERIIPTGLIVGETADSDVTRQARRIWRDNRLDVAVADAVRDACTVGAGYLLVTVGEDGQAVVTREAPEQLYVEPDATRPWRAIAAIKAWRDPLAKTDHLLMWADGMFSVWQRASAGDDGITLDTVSGGGWALVRLPVEYAGSVPVVILENKDGKGEFEDSTGLIDRINTGILYRLVTMAMQTYRQRALKVSGEDGEIPSEDADGNQIDYQAIFEPGPGALWELPPGVELWESATTDITPMLNAVKDDWRELAAATHTPVTAMLPDAANQSAAGAQQPMNQLVFKAQDRIKRFAPALAVAMVKALAVEGVELGVHETVEVKFEPPATVTLSEKYAAAAQARAAGEALETIQETILGMSPEQIAQDKQRRTEEQLLALINAAGGTGGG